MRYHGHFLKTRRQVMVQNILLLALLMPSLAWRTTQERLIVSLALGLLALAVFVPAFRGLRFLRSLERQHREPTAEMTFIFGLSTLVPLTMSAFLLVLLAQM